jgi:hypothetical protein
VHRFLTRDYIGLDCNGFVGNYIQLVLKTFHRLFRCQLDRILGNRRLSGLSCASESLAKYADRTEFHCSRKLVTATRAGALGFPAHMKGTTTTEMTKDANGLWTVTGGLFEQNLY